MYFSYEQDINFGGQWTGFYSSNSYVVYSSNSYIKVYYNLNLKYPQNSMVKSQVPSMVVLENGGTFKKWALVESFQVMRNMPSKGNVGPCCLPLSLFFHEVNGFSTWHSCHNVLPCAQSNVASQPCSETSTTVSKEQKQAFSLYKLLKLN